MSIILKQTAMKIRDKENDTYNSINVVAERTTDEMINDIFTQANIAKTSIPADYTSLSNDVLYNKNIQASFGNSGMYTFQADNFENGTWYYSTKTPLASRIRTIAKLHLNKGTIIKYNSATQDMYLGLLETELSNTCIELGSWIFTNNQEKTYTFLHDGYLIIAIRDHNNQNNNLNPSDYNCNISIYSANWNKINMVESHLNNIFGVPITVHFNSERNNLDNIFPVTAEIEYYFYTPTVFTGGLNIYVPEDPSTISYFHTNQITTFTPTVSGYIRLYNGNTNLGANDFSFFVIPAEIYKLQNRCLELENQNTLFEKYALLTYKPMIIHSEQLDELTNNTKSVNDFPNSSIVVVGDHNLGLTDYPVQLTSSGLGTYISFWAPESASRNGLAQLFISTNGCATRWKVAGNWSNWVVYKSTEQEEVYYVGPTRTYTSFISCLLALKNNTQQKTIYIDEGTYDIFADYVTEINNNNVTIPDDSIQPGDYFGKYNVFVPTNTKIVGLGNVILKFEPTVEQLENLSTDIDKTGYGASRTWSPLNIYGSVEIINITVKGHNCRYCLHNDDHGAYSNAVQKYKNCHFLYKYSDVDSNGRRLGFNYTTGFGLGENSTHIYEDCEFYMETNTNSPAFYGHSSGVGYSGQIILKNCRIYSSNYSNNATIRLQTLAHIQSYCKALFENCYINGKLNYSLYYQDSPNSFETTFINCNKIPITRTIASNGTIVDIFETKWFNPLPTPTADDTNIIIETV